MWTVPALHSPTSAAVPLTVGQGQALHQAHPQSMWPRQRRRKVGDIQGGFETSSWKHEIKRLVYSGGKQF